MASMIICGRWWWWWGWLWCCWCWWRRGRRWWWWRHMCIVSASWPAWPGAAAQRRNAVSPKATRAPQYSLPVFVISFVCIWICICRDTRASKCSLPVFVILFVCFWICICKDTQASKCSLPVFVILFVCICICICIEIWNRTFKPTCIWYFHCLYLYFDFYLQATCSLQYNLPVFVVLIFVLLLCIHLSYHCVFICIIVAFSSKSYLGPTIEPTALYFFFHCLCYRCLFSSRSCWLLNEQGR